MSSPSGEVTAGFTGANAFIHDPTPTAEVRHDESVWTPVAAAVRELVEATIRSTVDDDEAAAVAEEVRALTARLTASQVPGPRGVRYNDEGIAWNWGNAVVGKRNALAPPVVLEPREGGGLRAEFDLNASYEGPPGLVHGGVTMMVLDHLMGEVASAEHTRVTFTGTLTGRYRAPTPLGPVVMEGWISGEEGRKVFVDATLGSPDQVTVEAHGIFVVPSWAV